MYEIRTLKYFYDDVTTQKMRIPMVSMMAHNELLKNVLRI